MSVLGNTHSAVRQEMYELCLSTVIFYVTESERKKRRNMSLSQKKEKKRKEGTNERIHIHTHTHARARAHTPPLSLSHTHVRAHTHTHTRKRKNRSSEPNTTFRIDALKLKPASIVFHLAFGIPVPNHMVSNLRGAYVMSNSNPLKCLLTQRQIKLCRNIIVIR